MAGHQWGGPDTRDNGPVSLFIDVRVEALRNSRGACKGSLDELWQAAEWAQVTSIIRPYIEAVL
jgi:hypothetical protein